jgi:hypothetical protein
LHFKEITVNTAAQLNLSSKLGGIALKNFKVDLSAWARYFYIYFNSKWSDTRWL